jgi:hypothetical protein
LNNTPANELHTELEPVFNVNSYLKYLAVEVLSGHWDAYSYLSNNYYLYHNQQTDKFEFIPYDVDNTLGIDWVGPDWAIRNIYEWTMDGQNRPLTERLLENQVYKDRFSFFIEEVLTEYFDPTVIFPNIDDIKTMITPSAENDTYRTLDYGYSIQDFHDSYTQALGGHVEYGLKPYITSRYNNAVTQVTVNSVDPVISLIQYSHLFIDRDFEAFAYVDDEDAGPEVKLQYKINGGATYEINMFDNGTGNDLLAGDRIYSVLLNAPMNAPGTFEFSVSATDDETNISLEPINGMYLIVIPEPSDIELSINEIMASNSTIIKDEFNEYDDWVEIYNQGSEIVWLGDKYLSDDRFNPSKWQMPDVVINPDEYLLFWADDDTEQGDFHTSFKLSKDGEEIGIYDSELNSYAEIDYFEFGLQETDVSIGRIPNGTGPIQVLPWPTPGYDNEGDPYVGITGHAIGLLVYPNPFNNFLTIEFSDNEQRNLHLILSDITGKQIFEQEHITASDRIQIYEGVNSLRKGTYLLTVILKDKYSKTVQRESKVLIKQ